MKKAQFVRFLKVSGAVATTLFVAGVVAPSLLRAESAQAGISLNGPLQTMNIAGVSFSYKMDNIYAALLGVLFGTAVALIVISLPKLRKNRRPEQLTRFSLAG